MNLTPSLFEVSSKRKAMVKKKTPSKRLQKQADIQKATKKVIAEKVEELAIKKNELHRQVQDGELTSKDIHGVFKTEYFDPVKQIFGDALTMEMVKCKAKRMRAKEKALQQSLIVVSILETLRSH